MSKLGYFIGGALAGVVGVFTVAGIAVTMEERNQRLSSRSDDADDFMSDYEGKGEQNHEDFNNNHSPMFSTQGNNSDTGSPVCTDSFSGEDSADNSDSASIFGSLGATVEKIVNDTSMQNKTSPQA